MYMGLRSIDEIYIYLDGLYKVNKVEVPKMDFETKRLASPEVIEFIRTYKGMFDFYLQELDDIDNIIDSTAQKPKLTKEEQRLCKQSKSLCRSLRKLANDVVIGIKQTEANLIHYEPTSTNYNMH